MKKIDSRKHYSLGEIVRGELIPGVNTIAKASRLVNGLNVLKGQVVQVGSRGVQYKVLGSNILAYVKQNHHGKKVNGSKPHVSGHVRS